VSGDSFRVATSRAFRESTLRETSNLLKILRFAADDARRFRWAFMRG